MNYQSLTIVNLMLYFFDEVYMTNLYIYGKFLNSTEQHKHNKLIIGAGDCNQLPPISD